MQIHVSFKLECILDKYSDEMCIEFRLDSE